MLANQSHNLWEGLKSYSSAAGETVASNFEHLKEGVSDGLGHTKDWAGDKIGVVTGAVADGYDKVKDVSGFPDKPDHGKSTVVTEVPATIVIKDTSNVRVR